MRISGSDAIIVMDNEVWYCIDMYESHMKFLKDNRSYEEDGSPNMREQKEWMTNMSCVKIELDGATDLESNADIIVNSWSGIVE